MEDQFFREILGRYQYNRAGGDALPQLLQALGDPGRALRGMTVAGTNGKGSTCAFAVSVLAAAGMRVGSMPSPHLQQLTERIRVNGGPISAADCRHAYEQVDRAMQRIGRTANAQALHAAAAVAHFAREDVNLAVLEANIGGLRTAVNCFDTGVKVLTGVGLDHQELLGDSLAEIARNKAGIVRDGDHVVLGALPAEAAEAVGEVLERRTGLTVWRLHKDILVRQDARQRKTEHPCGQAGLEVSTPRARHVGLPCPLPGSHQHRNLALAVAGVDALIERGVVPAIPDETLRSGLAATRWPGRLELVNPARLEQWQGQVLLDSASNPQGVATVAPEILRRARTAERAAVVFGTVRNKDAAAMLAPLPGNWPVVFTRIGDANEADPGELRRTVAPREGCHVVSDTGEAVHQAAELVGRGGLITVLGFHSLVGRVRDILGLPSG
ncbi:Mur ligase family protein [Streptomyces sp. HNM0574]|uniref:bifunctional folylpolyglutamate synthase/dihydrofolate synthase n=1 Tax=Streptomyces sp. HNM0574 TaxID=2714954 RepID=UPI00146BA4E9|nr:Mur ligase family protein [Streptomyces sp. HNM0574]NLU66771.1 bifunctional folylpolyglutamate synthase/dihydrofolate synthase [Streptomyces sp. HNM0574]